MKKRIGQILVEAGVIDQFQLQSALGYQKQWGGRLGDVLVDRGFVKEPRLVQALSKQLGMTVASLRDVQPDRKVLDLVPRDLCEKLRVFPVELKGQGRAETLVLAMVDPTDLAALDQIVFSTRRRVSAVLAGKSDLDGAIERFYRGGLPAVDLSSAASPADAADNGDLLSAIEPIAATVSAPPPVADLASDLSQPADEDMEMTIEPVISGLQEDAAAEVRARAAAEAAEVAAAAAQEGAAAEPSAGLRADALFEGIGLEPEAAGPSEDDLAMELELPAESAAAGAAAWAAEQAAEQAKAQPAAMTEASAEEDVPEARIATKDLTELGLDEQEAEAPMAGEGEAPAGPAFAAEPAPAPEPDAAAPVGEDRLDALSAELDALAMDVQVEAPAESAAEAAPPPVEAALETPPEAAAAFAAEPPPEAPAAAAFAAEPPPEAPAEEAFGEVPPPPEMFAEEAVPPPEVPETGAAFPAAPAGDAGPWMGELATGPSPSEEPPPAEGAAVAGPIEALVRLLIQKGIFSEEEWLEELRKP